MNLPEIHLLQAAIMLAEVRNYSRAARKLGIQQPTLTKRILELEHFIGFPLFLRSTQFVEPTEACQQFLKEAKECLFHAERAVYVVRIAEQGAQSVLHIGKSQYIDPYLISVLTSVSLPLFPNLEVSLSSMSFTELENEILLGKLDLAVAIGEFDNPNITQLELMRTPFYIAVPEDSSLAGFKELTLAMLNQRSWLLFDRDIHPLLHDSILSAADQERVRPRSIHHIVTAEESAQELYSGTGDVAFLTRAGAWRIARNGLTMRPLIHSGLNISSKLIARADDSSRAVSEFAKALRLKLDRHRRDQLDLPLNAKAS